MKKWRPKNMKLFSNTSARLLLFVVCVVISNSLIPLEPRASIGPDERTFVMYSPDSKAAVTVSGNGFDKTGPIRVWDVLTGHERLSLAPNWSVIETIDFSPDGLVLAAHEKEGDLKLWNVLNGQELASFKPFTRFGNWVNFRFCPDGKNLIIQDHGNELRPSDGVKFWDIAKRQDWASIESYFYSLAVSEQGKKLITWERKNFREVTSLKVWDFDSQLHNLRCIKEHSTLSDEIALTPDGRTFACVTHPDKAEASAIIELRDVDSGALRCKFPYTDEETHIQSLSFSPKGLLLLSRGGGGTQLSWKTRSTVWEISQVPPRELASFSESLIMSPDNKWLAVPRDDGVELHEVASMEKKVLLEKHGDQGPARIFGISNGLKSHPELEFSPDGNILAVARLFSTKEEHPVVKWFSEHIYRIPTDTFGRIVRLWDVQTGKELASIKAGKIARFSPDGKTLATLEEDGSMKFWDVPFRKPSGKVVGLAMLFWTICLSLLMVARRLRVRWNGEKITMQPAV